MTRLELENVAWCEISGTLILLDIVGDRYFQLPAAQNSDIVDRIYRGDIPHWHQPHWMPKPIAFETARFATDDTDFDSFNVAEVARALWTQRRVERQLSSKGFELTLRRLSEFVTTRHTTVDELTESAKRTITAFDQGRLIRTAADRCLPRSIALTLSLAARGTRAQLVIGVKLAPFGAHCWVQLKDRVLNETAEEVMRYQPILVL